MMEWWNIGKSKIPSLAGLFLKGNISLINFLGNPAHSGTNSPCEISHREPYLAGQTIIPISQNHYFYPVKLSPISLGASFHYSNNPIEAKPLGSY
jgi:hypothetical protein